MKKLIWSLNSFKTPVKEFSFDKVGGYWENKFEIRVGSFENRDILKSLVNILEKTQAALQRCSNKKVSRKIYRKFTRERPCRSAIWANLWKLHFVWVLSCKFAVYFGGRFFKRTLLEGSLLKNNHTGVHSSIKLQAVGSSLYWKQTSSKGHFEDFDQIYLANFRNIYNWDRTYFVMIPVEVTNKTCQIN